MKLLKAAFVMMSLFAVYYGQKPVSPDCRLQKLAIEAALGSAEAQYNLGVEFYTGNNISRDYDKAAIMWRLVTEGGVLTGAFNNLGFLTYYGKGVKQDYAEGIRLWKIAAENGFPESQVHLATAYSDGRHLKANYIEAYAWARAGKYFAEPAQDAEIVSMAERRLAEVRKNLTNPQLTQAEKKAEEYIKKFAPQKAPT
jgi:TPR repeat protein